MDSKYMVHRGKRWKLGKMCTTQKAAENYRVPKSVLAKTPNKRVQIATVKVLKGKNRGKFGAYWRPF